MAQRREAVKRWSAQSAIIFLQQWGRKFLLFFKSYHPAAELLRMSRFCRQICCLKSFSSGKRFSWKTHQHVLAFYYLTTGCYPSLPSLTSLKSSLWLCLNLESACLHTCLNSESGRHQPRLPGVGWLMKSHIKYEHYIIFSPLHL